jgi:uncharacterized repeat protein (TIGR01451 family)
VLADPDNVATDPQGTDAPSTDRDYPVQSRGRDLVRFAYTWDASRLGFYVQRYGSSNNTNSFLFYADRDDDGLMEFSDRVVLVQWWGNSRWFLLTVCSYNPAVASGDPLVDASGFADGYTLPGSRGTGLYFGFGFGGSADGMQLEVSVPWNWIGVAAGDPLQFHVAAASSTNIPNSVDDNMAGPGGAGGTTHWAMAAVSPDQAVSAASGDTVALVHAVANGGNFAVPFEMWVQGGCGGPYDATLYQDADGDGSLDPGTDPPLADSNGDGTVDRVVAPGAPLAILVVVRLPAGLPAGTVCTLQSCAAPRGAPDCGGCATDDITIVAPQLTLLHAVDRPAAAPGALLTYTTTYTNAGSDSVRTVVLQSAVPANTIYVAGSAAGAGTVMAWSHDNGTSWDASEAPPVTHVRWTRLAALAVGGAGSVSFQVQVN